MAKGLRSSVKKTNRSKLRKNVFGPAENERAERIHQKLLENLQAPKPEPAKKAEMDVDSTEGTQQTHTLDILESLAKTSPDAAVNTKETEGSFLTIVPIPRSLTTTEPIPTPAKQQDDHDMWNLCFCLGLSSDIVGFATSGDGLTFAFDLLPPPCASKK